MNALQKYLADTGDTLGGLAQRIGVAITTVTRPLRGHRPAGTDLALKVELATGGKVSASEFMDICLAARREPAPVKRRGAHTAETADAA